MKQVTIVFTGHKVSQELIDFGRGIGAQFRNGQLVEGLEPCDFVAGEYIPDIYSEHKRHPRWAEFTGVEVAPVADHTAEDTDGEIELTAEYLEGLTKKQMLELVADEELELTSEQTKSAASLLEALKAIYEL